MKTFDTAEDIRRALEMCPEAAAEKLLSVIAHVNVDPSKVYGLAIVPVNQDHMERLNKMLDGPGNWSLIRLQTQWSQMYGHQTYAYLAKISAAR